MALSTAMPSFRQASSVFGAVLIGGMWFATFYLGKDSSVRFLEADKAEIQGISNQICAVAKQGECVVVWGGKQKWFGTLQPDGQGLAVAGLDHVREALPSPKWRSADVTGGTQFTNGQYEVFVSAVSGAITITRSVPAE